MPSTQSKLARTLIVATVATLLLAAACSSGADSSHSAKGPTTSSVPSGGAPKTNALVGKDGRFAHAAPRLAKQVTFTPTADGGATATFRVAYDVAHPNATGGAAPDKAIVAVTVASAMNTTGPQPTDQAFTKTITDTGLDSADIVRDYSIDLPAKAYAAVRAAGDAGLHLVNVEVQQYRDFQVVDGKWDWIYGTTFDAAASPTKPSDNPGGAVTVRNDTGTGIYAFNWPAYSEPVGQVYGPNLVPQQQGYSQVSSSSQGVPIALAGQAVSCLYQGTDGSNPSGFSTTLDPGMAVTQTIVADDSSHDQPANAGDTAEVSQAVIQSIDGTLKLIAAGTDAEFSAPFTLIVKMADVLFGLGTNCNNQPNVFQLGAVTADGKGTNATSWAISDGCSGTCGGLANVYSSPWESSAPDSDAQMSTEAVQLVPSAVTYQGQPLWLNQVPIGSGCGVGNGSNSNTSGCTAQNTISLRWITSPPCPWTNGLKLATGTGVQGNNSWCFQEAPTSPAIPSCGTNNANCVAYKPS